MRDGRERERGETTFHVVKKPSRHGWMFSRLVAGELLLGGLQALASAD